MNLTYASVACLFIATWSIDQQVSAGGAKYTLNYFDFVLGGR